MLPLIGIFAVLAIASGAASNWQLPSGWVTQPSPLPKVPPKRAVKHVAPKRPTAPARKAPPKGPARKR